MRLGNLGLFSLVHANVAQSCVDVRHLVGMEYDNVIDDNSIALFDVTNTSIRKSSSAVLIKRENMLMMQQSAE